MKRHALFVGVDNYIDPTIQDLSFPSEDASDLAGAFKWSLKFDRVEKLLGPEHADDIVDAVGSMTRGLGSGDLFFFFFAGHGFRVKDNHVLVCAKDNWDDLEDEDAGLRVGRLKRKLRGPFDRMIVLDACQNDIRATRGADAGATARDLSLIHGGDAVARPGEGVQVLVTSCSEGQKALEVADLRHGLFTSAFLETVRTFADGRRFLDPGILKDDLSSRMQSLAVRYRLGGMQEPMFTIPGNARIVLLDGTSAPPLPHDGTPVAPTVVVCPICGKKNDPRDTFKCRECRRDNLCLRHQDEESFLCRDCAAKASAAGEAKATKEAGMAEGNPEEAERKAREASEAKALQNRAEKERQAREAERLRRLAEMRSAEERKKQEEAAHKAAEERRRMGEPGKRKVVSIVGADISLRWCPPGTFTMGSLASEEGRFSVERQHSVTLTKGFWMGETPVTQGLWKAVMSGTERRGGFLDRLDRLLGGDINPSLFKEGYDYPVECVSWADCQKFLKALNQMAPQGGFAWLLPTEAEWEYACRAGSTGPYGGTGQLGDMGWYDGNSGSSTHPVGWKAANAWGLKDMHGNVCEWCRDWYGDYPKGAATDPTGPSSGSGRVVRGGSWDFGARSCRSAYRAGINPDRCNCRLGFRVALVDAR